ncbi:MAG: hypothetical protein KGJ13_06260 [Patescibacteria group bacterium]|nr:hypothetical protein [Patescibacteria group bacterium]
MSGKDFELQPWLMVNTKGDKHLLQIAALDGVQTISVNDTPGDTGLYHVQPKMPEQGPELDAMLGRIWEKGNCGIYIDEGYMIHPANNLNACLTQGRSRNIPMIVLSQRPVWISKFVFSECDYVQLFNLKRRNDRKEATDFVPVDKDYRLAPHCSYWYNEATELLVEFGPVPNNAAILDTFRSKFPPEHEPKEVGGVTVYAPIEKRQMTKRVI